MEREIIEIDEDKCTGCGKCIPNCPEGALQIIDEKARLVSDLFCDGLGACVGHCPEDAMTVVKREAEVYEEKKVMENIVKQGANVIKAHLIHLKEHGATDYLDDAIEYLVSNDMDVPNLENEHVHQGCPGAQVREFHKDKSSTQSHQESALQQWPVQLNLLPPMAPFFKDADLLIAADCVPIASADFHSKLLSGKVLAIGCPKFDDLDEYQQKLTMIFKQNNIKSVTVAIMEVPCCQALYRVTEEALKSSGKDIPLETKIVSIQGDIGGE